MCYGTSYYGDPAERSRPDESLRGLRVLPFDTHEPDLAAEYLANNLSCLVRQQDVEELVLYVQPLRASSPHPLDTVMRLLDNQLSRFQEVRVTGSEGEAGFVLRGEAHEIQPGLFQLWLILSPKAAGEHLAGIDTATYIHTGRSGNALPAVAERVIERPQTPSLRLLAAAPTRCSEDAWGVQDADCPRLQVDAGDGDRVFVIAWSPAGGLRNWTSDACRYAAKPARGAQAPTGLVLPLDPGFRESGGTVYAIAARGNGPEARLQQHLAGLRPGCERYFGQAAAFEAPDSWLRELDRIMAEDAARVAWSARRLTAEETAK